MACEIYYDDPVCAAKLDADPFGPTGADNRVALAQQLTEPNNKVEEKLNLHTSNIYNGDTGSEDDQSKVSFEVAPFLGAMARAYRITGTKKIAQDMVSHIDTIFYERNDEALEDRPEGSIVKDGNGEPDSFVPYKTKAAPQKDVSTSNPLFPLDQTHRGWSRWAPAFVKSAEPTARARPELLTDGIICLFILQALEVIQECGLVGSGANHVVNESKLDQWGVRLKQLIELWDVQWREDETFNTNRSCQQSVKDDPASEQATLEGSYVDIFGKPYPLNQQGLLLSADLLYEKVFGPRTMGGVAVDPKDRARRFIDDISSFYYIAEGGVDKGWHYTLFCACIEPWEDLGHSAFTMEFLKVAVQRGVTNALPMLTRMVNSLMENAYIGAGDWWWYNTGEQSHGSTGASIRKEKWNAGSLPSACADKAYSSGAGGGHQEVYIPIIMMTNLPEPLWSDPEIQDAINDTMTLWSTKTTSDSLGLGNAKDYLALYSYKLNLCKSLLSDTPTPTVQCIDETASSVSIDIVPPCSSEDPLIVTADINPGAGLPGYFVKIVGPTGFAFYPSYSPIDNKWYWDRPDCCLDQCINGVYRVDIIPPDDACMPWTSATSFTLDDCSGS